MKKACKISLIVLGTVVGLLLAVNFLAGPIAKNYVLKHDKELPNDRTQNNKGNLTRFFHQPKAFTPASMRLRVSSLPKSSRISPMCGPLPAPTTIRRRPFITKPMFSSLLVIQLFKGGGPDEETSDMP